jgi:redox-sensitive bicupin YhaK (pirin superfamily)
MIEIKKSNERGQADHGWLKARHSFSFADYYDPENTSFRTLRVINEDQVAPEMGFGMHPHRDMEIITYVVSGSVRHRDSMGNTAAIGAGEVQRISAGTGISHSEINDSASEPLHLLQIWITPDERNVKPSYAEKSFAEAASGQLHLVASKSGRADSIPIHQDADVWLGKLHPGEALEHNFASRRHGWLQVIRGELEVNGRHLDAGDALSVSATDTLTVAASQPSEFLLFDLN